MVESVDSRGLPPWVEAEADHAVVRVGRARADTELACALSPARPRLAAHSRHRRPGRLTFRDDAIPTDRFVILLAVGMLSGSSVSHAWEFIDIQMLAL